MKEGEWTNFDLCIEAIPFGSSQVLDDDGNCLDVMMKELDLDRVKALVKDGGGPVFRFKLCSYSDLSEPTSLSVCYEDDIGEEFPIVFLSLTIAQIRTLHAALGCVLAMHKTEEASQLS